MRIKQLRLENFKLFRNAQIDFKPLTLLTGTNSSGKSTVLNAITSVLQSQPPHNFPFELVPNGKYCTLGGYRNIAYGRNTRAKFSIGLSIEESRNEFSIDARFRHSSARNQIVPDKVLFESSKKDRLELIWKGQERKYEVTIESASLTKMLSQKWMKAFTEELLDRQSSGETKKENPSKPEAGDKEAEFRAEAKETVESFFRDEGPQSLSFGSRTTLGIIQELQEKASGSMLSFEISTLLGRMEKHIAYIGPVRAYPSRFYFSLDSSQSIDPTGKNSIALLYEWKKHFPAKFRDVIKQIQLLEMASKVDARSNLDEILQMNVQPFQHSERVNLADVGFGISQILPVIIANIALPHGGTLLVNQPEVHLHPSSQAMLGNYFSSSLENRNYILETHSEYLINRLRLLAVEKKYDVNDVLILFFESPKAKATSPKIHRISIADDGSLVNAPKSFFETYYLDTFHIAMGGSQND